MENLNSDRSYKITICHRTKYFKLRKAVEGKIFKTENLI